jgi:hypothetical protein
MGCSWNSSEGILTSYGLDFPGVVSQSGKEVFLFYQSVQFGSGVTQPPIQRVPGFFSGGEMAGV